MIKEFHVLKNLGNGQTFSGKSSQRKKSVHIIIPWDFLSILISFLNLEKTDLLKLVVLCVHN
jgi:hypothetical protein